MDDDYYDRLVGTVVDERYVIDRKLGVGGMGVVFEAHHNVIDKRVALKVLRRELTRDKAGARRFLQEARAASKIGHAHIVDVTDFGSFPDGAPYFAMEYIDGQTLASFIANNAPVPVDVALPIVGQLARGLHAAHEKGVIHRDLKPDNVFLIERDGRPNYVKILDFGIARVISDDAAARTRLTRAGSVFGTPRYMAPEQAQGASDVDARIDVYALGTILYELLTGRVPHQSKNAVTTIAMQISQPIVPPSQVNPSARVSSALEEVVMMSLARDRSDRFSSMLAFETALSEVAAGVAVESLPPAAGLRLRASPGILQSSPDAPTIRPDKDQGPNPFAIMPSTPVSLGARARGKQRLHAARPETDVVAPQRSASKLPWAIGLLTALALALAALWWAGRSPARAPAPAALPIVVRDAAPPLVVVPAPQLPPDAAPPDAGAPARTRPQKRPRCVPGLKNPYDGCD